MAHLQKRIPYLLLLGLLAATVVTVSGCAPVLEQTPDKASTTRAITVVGQGTTSVKPDLAMASLGVETIAPTVAAAMEQNNAKMAAVMAKLKALNIPDKDIQTSGFSINSFNQGSPKGMVEGSGGDQYRVSNMVQVKVRQLDQIGAVLDGVVQVGANQVYGVNFTVEDPHALQGQAREKAMADAQQRAEALAKLANVKVGQVLTVTEGGANGPVFAGAAYAFGKGAADGAGTPLSPGEVQISYQVQVTYAIE